MSTPRQSTGQSGSRHRSTLSLQKTEVTIHVYDLLPVRTYPDDELPHPLRYVVYVLQLLILLSLVNSQEDFHRFFGLLVRRCFTPAWSSVVKNMRMVAMISAV